jgi:hypothetical protein
VGQPIEDAAKEAAQQESKPLTDAEAAAAAAGALMPVPDMDKATQDAAVADSINKIQQAQVDDNAHLFPNVARAQAGLDAAPMDLDVEKTLIHAQHLYIKAQRAYVYNHKLDELATAQDSYIEVLTLVLEKLHVL